MALSVRLQGRQVQSLVITPQLMQAIRLLQMSGLELERFVAAELEQNPLLELDETGEPATAEFAPEADAARVSEDGADVAADAVDAEPADLYPEQAGADAGWTLSLPGRPGRPASLDDLGIDQTLPAKESLAELIERKIDAVFSLPAERAIALALFAALDEAGYLTSQPDVIARMLGVAPETVERVLRTCQDFAPSGIFARSLAECLELQLAERSRLDQPMRTLLANLDRLASGQTASLAALCGVGRAGLDELIAELRTLDPKPGLAFAHEPVRTLVPDVFVRAGPDGDWIVELNDEVLPRLIVNNAYCARVSARIAGAERAYMDECRDKAKWLKKSLDQRARTVLRVASEIVRRQEGFLVEGVAHLRPLNLRMVADALGIHESTVSRAAANKTIATPRGIFEFRYFFTGAIPATAGGEAHSAEAVKHRIRKLIMEEPPDAILSDDAIVAVLSREGVEIARRTVAKYRELMRIGSSVERRREKRLRAAS
jgi:RNA polymerase sigma-54 factor